MYVSAFLISLLSKSTEFPVAVYDDLLFQTVAEVMSN